MSCCYYCYCVTPQISETAHRTLGLACGLGTVGLQWCPFPPQPSTPTCSPAIGGESTFTYCGVASLRGLWVILCYYSLDGSPLRGVASLLHCGRTPLVGVKITNFSKNAQNDPPWSKTPFRNPLG